jgi:putative tryptophan/tyrosine transport system substrate-binding protein
MNLRIKRRSFLASLAATAASWSRAAGAQQMASVPLIGWVSSRSETESASVRASFHKGLAEADFVEGQNVAVLYRWAEGRYDLLPALAVELVNRKVDCILAAGGPPTVVAAKAATTSIPIVFIANNPVELGIVASLDRPGGNLTGIGLLVADLVAKQLEFLKEVVPQASALAYLQNPKSPTAALNEGSVRDAARSLGIKLNVIHASAEVELDKAFEAIAALGSRGVIVEGDPYFDSRRERIIALATQHSVVGCYPWREYAVLGGLMSYGSNLPDAYRQSAHYVGRILKGAKPADLPVERPDKFELVLNLKAAKALGIAIPPTLVARADELIE